MTVSAAPERGLVLDLARDVTLRDDEPYLELEVALEALICKIQGLPCADPHVDWPAIIGEALSLRPVHGD